ncbi:glutathione ABC transporter substrate-binding protein [Anaerobacillus alkalidiazotrophicus]|uniref:Glutathione ABC transporter substrate-binding protein n=1 Tax=Anaerobacillus alkalidiazotrophicus TaxID=472963 RepID=A0A1S2M7F7_9BACI|nr:glutathione ABC transporter substrate-binding protein [Anaerobacillus alkalidiazotrophicus]OIJ20413.1 glutathione ABC transporter substrate-binding protein [Anaerobacillus alkalidiazotrophicus]
MFSKNKFFMITIALLLSFVIAACGAQDDAAPADEEVEVVEGGDLVIALPSDAVSLDPHGSNDSPSSNVATNIYDSLLLQDANGELHPALATEWDLVEDTVWEFKLREGVKFHDDSDFNAEVVKANFDRVLDPEVASPRSFLFDMITDVTVVDEFTVQFTTEFPFAPLPSHLAHTGGGIISLESIEADYAAMAEGKDPGSVVNENPVGTGQFVYEEWVPGQYVKLAKNENYWGEQAKIDTVTFKVVPEDQTRIAELETGNSHIIEQVRSTDVSRIDANPDSFVEKTDSLSLAYIGFNLQKAPFDDVRVRQAISMAVNKDIIIDGLLDGFGTPAVGPLAPNVFGFNENVSPISYDVEKAKELLAEAGYEDGFKTTIWTNDNPARMDTAEFVQSQLKEIGVDVEIEVMEWGAYLAGTASGEHDMFILGWVTVTADADYGMYALFHSNNHGEAGNRSFIANDELDEILDAARQESDPEVRHELYTQAQEILVEEAPMLYTHHQQYLVGVSENVQGFWQHPNGMFQLGNVTIKQ